MPLKFLPFFLMLVVVSLSSVLAEGEAGQSPAMRGDIIYGSADAPVEIIEYGSLTCSHCGHFAREVFPELKTQYVDTGKVRFIFRNFVRDRYDMAIATISRCSSDIKVIKSMVDAYFVRQDEWMKAENPYEVISEIAKQAGLSQDNMAQCMSDRSLQEHLLKMRKEGVEVYKISGVPFLVLNGMPIKGHTFEALKAAIDAAL